VPPLRQNVGPGRRCKDAEADNRSLRVERDDDHLRPRGRSPTLADFVGVYEQPPEVSGKRAASVEKEKALLRGWRQQLGHLRLDKIQPHHLSRVLTTLTAAATRRGL
jgi:hypothetical protein